MSRYYDTPVVCSNCGDVSTMTVDRGQVFDDLLATTEALVRCMEGDGDRWRHCHDLDHARAIVAAAKPKGA